MYVYIYAYICIAKLLIKEISESEEELSLRRKGERGPKMNSAGTRVF